MKNVGGDLRYVLRVLWRHRTLNLVALTTLALAIGATTAIFSVVNALLIQPLPYPDSGRLVQILKQYRDGFGTAVPAPKFLFWHAQRDASIETMAAYDNFGSGFNLTGGLPERVVGSRVSADFLRTLGVAPVLGRDFRAEDDVPGAAKVVIVSHGLWERRFGARTDVIGQTIALNDEPYAVIGVMPSGFAFPAAAMLWTPLQLDPASRDAANYLQVVGRLRPGATLDETRTGLALVADRFRAVDRALMQADESVGARPLREALYGRVRPALMVLFAAVGCVLLIACVNVANLQIAQAAARHREIALRTALGADAWRIARLLLFESLVLALVGGVLGVLTAAVAVQPLVALSPVDAFRSAGVHLDATVLAFALALSLGSGLLFGLLPAWQARRATVEDVLRDASLRTTGGRGGARMRRVLVAAEVALALMLTVGASMLIKSLSGLYQRDTGFAAGQVLTMKLSLPEAKYGEVAALAGFQARVEAQLRAVPGVRAAVLAGSAPLETDIELPVAIAGRFAPGRLDGLVDAQTRLVGAQYFDVLRIPLRAGRAFDARDREGAPPVAIISESIARKYWPQGDAVGHRITIGETMRSALAERTPREIVGIVGDVRETGISAVAPPPVVYVPLAQGHPPLVRAVVRLLPATVLLRTDVAPASVARAAQRAIWQVDANPPVTNVLLMEEIVARSLGSHRFNTLLLSLLAGLALLLAAVGLYGVLSHLVGQRVREVGVRMAIGASRGRVLALFLRQGLGMVATGAVIGLAGAAALTRLLGSLVVDVSVHDPWLFALAPVLLLIVGALAIAGPALRAARIDPARALRD